MRPALKTPVQELAEMLVKVLATVERDCEFTPSGHERSCQCRAHIEVREVTAQAEALLEKVGAA